MPSIYITSDQHYLHQNIIKYCKRPQNHNQVLMERYNSLVRQDDIVFFLGDIACGLSQYADGRGLLKKIFKGLKGEKHLIRGNHDNLGDEFYIKELDFRSIQDYIIINDILICHYPLSINQYSDQKEIDKIEELKKIYLENNLKAVIHGHIHTYQTYNKLDVTLDGEQVKHFNVAVDTNDYYPLVLKEVIETLQ